jgi:hypothetical protein
MLVLKGIEIISKRKEIVKQVENSKLIYGSETWEFHGVKSIVKFSHIYCKD